MELFKKNRCRDCRFFIPDQVGDGFGLGRCGVFEFYQQKGLSDNDLKPLLLKLGVNKPLFWGGTGYGCCEKYQSIPT